MPVTQQRRWKLVRARREAVPTSVRRSHQKLRPRVPRSGRPVIYGLFGAIVIGALAWVVYGTSTLGLRGIEVTGSVIAGPDLVRAAAAVPLGTPLARVDTGQVEARVRALPSVAVVEVSRSWPHTLVIAVTERSPVGVVARDASFLVLDADGVVFHEVPAPPAGAALMRLAAPGPDDAATRAALRVLAALTAPLRESLVEVVADSPTRIRLELSGGRAVVWGDATHNETKARVATALLATGAATIDVSVPDVATTS